MAPLFTDQDKVKKYPAKDCNLIRGFEDFPEMNPSQIGKGVQDILCVTLTICAVAWLPSSEHWTDSGKELEHGQTILQPNHATTIWRTLDILPVLPALAHGAACLPQESQALQVLVVEVGNRAPGEESLPRAPLSTQSRRTNHAT